MKIVVQSIKLHRFNMQNFFFC